MSATLHTIEVVAGEIAAELGGRGIGSDEKVTLTFEPAQEMVPGRRALRARVVASVVTYIDIDCSTKRAKKEVEPQPE